MQIEHLTSAQVVRRYQISLMTLHRWSKDEKLAFPKPMVVNRRKLWREDELEKWERQKVRGAA